MKYLMFIKHKESTTVQPPPALMAAMGEFVGRMFQQGLVKDTGGLKPLSQSTVIRSNGGKLQVIDGPYSEAKEVIGGYALVEVSSHAQAMEVATEFMELHRVHWPEFECESEIRQVEEV